MSTLFFEEVFCVAGFFASLGDFFLEVFHDLDLFCEAFPPELFPFVVLDFPVAEFCLDILDVLAVSIVDSQVVLLFLLQQIQFSFGPQLVHAVVRQFLGQFNDSH